MNEQDQQAEVRSNDGLGDLPKPTLEDHCWELWGQNVQSDFYTAEQMRAYAAQAVAAERERWRTAARLVLEATPDQMPLALDALRDVLGPNVAIKPPVFRSA